MLGEFVGGLGELGKSIVRRWLLDARAKVVEAAEADRVGVEPPADADKLKETIVRCAQPLLRSLYSTVVKDLGVTPVKPTEREIGTFPLENWPTKDEAATIINELGLTVEEGNARNLPTSVIPLNEIRLLLFWFAQRNPSKFWAHHNAWYARKDPKKCVKTERRGGSKQRQQVVLHDVSVTEGVLALYHNLSTWVAGAVAAGPAPWGRTIIVDGGSHTGKTELAKDLARQLAAQKIKVALMAHSNLDAAKLDVATACKQTGAPLNTQMYATEDVINGVARRLHSKQVFIIDNAHKMPPALLQLINSALQNNTGLDDVWFGGLPVIMLVDTSVAPTVAAAIRGSIFSQIPWCLTPVVYRLERPFGVDTDYRSFTDALRERSISRQHAQKLISGAAAFIPGDAIVLVRDAQQKKDHDSARLRSIAAEEHILPARIERLSELPSDADQSKVITWEYTRSTQLIIRVGARVQLLAKVGPHKKHTLATVVSVSPDAEQPVVTVQVDSSECTATVCTIEELLGKPGDSSTTPGGQFAEYERWSYVPLRLGYAFTPDHAAGLPFQKVHVLMTSWELGRDNTFNYHAFSRARAWDSVSWGLPDNMARPESPEDLARQLGLTLLG